MDMREYIAQRLDGMKSVTEKDMLRDVMEDIFIPLYDHIEGQYARLERLVKEQTQYLALLGPVHTTSSLVVMIYLPLTAIKPPVLYSQAT